VFLKVFIDKLAIPPFLKANKTLENDSDLQLIFKWSMKSFVLLNIRYSENLSKICQVQNKTSPRSTFFELQVAVLETERTCIVYEKEAQ